MADVWTDRLSEYLDGELSDADVASLENHLAGCSECIEILGQLRAVANRAAQLEDRAPPKDLWVGIETALREKSGDTAPGVPIGEARSRWKQRVVFSLPQLLAASIALCTLSAGSVWLALRNGEEVVGASFAQVPEQEAATVLMASFDNSEYDAVVRELEGILEERRDMLDPSTVMVLERSLATIDLAIAEARAALVNDPTNSYLSEHLSATMDQKVRLLRQAARIATAAS